MGGDTELWVGIAEAIAKAHAADGPGQAAHLWAVTRTHRDWVDAFASKIDDPNASVAAYEFASLGTLDGAPRQALLGVTVASETLALAVSAEAYVNPPDWRPGSGSEREEVLTASLVAPDGSRHQCTLDLDGSVRPAAPVPANSIPDDPEPYGGGMIAILLRHILGLPLGVPVPQPEWALAGATVSWLLEYLEEHPPSDAEDARQVVTSTAPMMACGIAWPASDDGRLVSDPRAAEIIRAIAAGELGPSALTDKGRDLLHAALVELGEARWTVIGATPGGQALLTEVVREVGLDWTGDDLTGILLREELASPDELLEDLARGYGQPAADAAEDALRVWWRRESGPDASGAHILSS